ncbi:MAG: hypothetical protein ACXVFU_14515 [Nocardioidaceae bacterium]
MSSRGALAALAARIGPSTWRRPVTASSGSGRRALLALAVYLAVAALVYGPTVRHPLHSTLDGGRGDVGLFLWFLANTSRAVQVGHGLLVTHALNAPYGVNAMWNTGLLLPGLLLAPLTAWAGPVLSLNVIILAGPALSAWSAYLCSGRWVTGRSARLVTGLVFGFSPAVLAASLGHYHLTLLMWVPPLLLVTADGLTGRRGPVRSGLLLGLLATLQLLTGEEVLVLVGMAGALLVVVLAVQMRSAVRSRLLPGLVTAAVAAVTTVLLAGVPLYVQFLGPMRVSGSIQAPDVYVLDPLRTVVPPSVVLLHPRWLQATLHPLPLNAAESMGYLGLPLLVLIAFVVWRRRSDVVTRTVTATAAVLWVLALGYTLHLGGIRTGIPLPWRLSARLPVLGSLLPVRWVLVIMLFVALLVGMAVETLPAAGRRRALGAALVALALLPLLPARAPVGQPTGTPSFFLSGAKALQGTVLVVPVPRPLHDEAMTWAAEAGARFAMPGGYFIGPQGGRGPGADRPRFGDVPRPTERVLLDLASNGLLRPISLAERVRARADFRFWGVRSVVLGPARHEQALLLWLTRLLNRAPVADDGVWLWAPVSPTQI